MARTRSVVLGAGVVLVLAAIGSNRTATPAASPSPTPSATILVEATVAPTATPEPTVTPTPEPIVVPSEVKFTSCAAAKEAGAAPLHRGDPGYSLALDRDGDGTACEN